MSKIKVVGSAVVIESSMSLEDLKLIKKYRPSALTLMEMEGDELTPVFQIGVTDRGVGEISSFGASFASEIGERKLAGITMVCADMPATPDAQKEMIADQLGAAIGYLNKLESELPGVVTEIKRTRESVMDSITIG